MRGRTNLRNHRKLAVADGIVLWSGGQNLAVEYFVDRGDEPAWIDLGFTVRGPLAASVQHQFDEDWQFAGGASMAAASGRRTERAAKAGDPWAQWVPSGPDRRDDTVHGLLMTAAYHAKTRILAVTPYFVPDDALLQALIMATRRGARVSLVLPARSNHRLADMAREKSVRALVEAGAEVSLLPRMVHAKVIVVDDSLALCGSLNLDGRSLFLNYEAMAAFYGKPEVAWLAQWAQSLAATGQPHSGSTPSLARDVLEGVVRAIGFQL
jgi:cardiolipin synthase